MDISFLAENEKEFYHFPTTASMDNALEDYNLYWETNTLFQPQEIDNSWKIDDLLNQYFDTSSPDGATSSPAEASKNIVSERNRRKKLNDRLLALRIVVPNITKMDKASIIKDAIKYIEELHEEEKKIQAEIMELENERNRIDKNTSGDASDDHLASLVFFGSEIKNKKHSSDMTFPIEVLELSLTSIGETAMVVKVRCREKGKTMVNICRVFESLKIKVMTSNIISVSDTLLMTVFVEAAKEEINDLKMKIEAAIASHNYDSQSS